jgi:phosphonate ABC transporter permease subunit PhnE
MKIKKPSILRSLGLGLGIVLALVIYAYGFQVTNVNLEETRSERRQTQLVRIIRALAQPQIIEYDREEFNISVPYRIPCPPQGYAAPPPDTNGPYVIITPACSAPGAEINVEGFNLEPDTIGPLNLYPVPEVPLQIGTVETDSNGHFKTTAKLPRQRTSDELMEIRVTTRRNIGAPHFSRAARDTWDKIIETVFLALLATTFGTIIAAPLSFLAARNLMKDVTNTLSGVALSIIAIPPGLWLGAQLAGRMSALGGYLAADRVFTLAGVVIAPLLGLFLARWALPQEDQSPSMGIRLMRAVALLFAFLSGVLTLYLVSNILQSTGGTLHPLMGGLGFIGTFVSDLGEILGMLVVLITAFAMAGVFSNLAGRAGRWMNASLSSWVNKVINVILSPLAGAVFFAILGAGINWLYQIDDLGKTLYWPGGIGMLLGTVLAIWRRPTDPMPIGLTIYGVTRTILNGLRSIESLVMVIVFVVWVGIGPFAGVLALALHTIAANAKLYSEQVESILPGPLEALQATGATRLQTNIYAVIPQIIPPFISLTMYRWDINVRMSTIIGFAGGGGIGFLLQQNMNLLNYRAASVQMLAIAVVVASMDYLSSKMREQVV